MIYYSMAKCLKPHHDLDDFTTYDLTTFMTSRLLIDLETGCTMQKSSFYIDSKSLSRESRAEVVSREVVQVVMWSQALCHTACLTSKDRRAERYGYIGILHVHGFLVSYTTASIPLIIQSNVAHQRYRLVQPDSLPSLVHATCTKHLSTRTRAHGDRCLPRTIFRTSTTFL